MKKRMIVGIVVVALLGAVGVFYKTHQKAAAPAPVETQPEKTAPAPVSTDVPAVPAPVVEKGYVINVLSNSKSVTGLSISLGVFNDGDTDLTLNPYTQFKLVGTTTATTRAPRPGEASPALKGTIKPNTELKGSIVFDPIAEEQNELRFFPDPASTVYVVVPLIASSQN